MPMTWFQRRILNHIQAQFSTLEKGYLTVVLPDKSSIEFGDSADLSATIEVCKTWFFNSIQKGGEIGFGESYMKGEWDSDAPELVIEYMILNMSKLRAHIKGQLWSRLYKLLTHKLRKNTKKNSRSNISDHYDLGNDFYELFLDPTMMYSSGYYKLPSDSLTTAQEQKVDRLIDQLNISDGDHILEIGSGWGYVAISMARRCACRITTITLSVEQKAYVEQRVAAEGLSDRISVELVDYRDQQGQFDAIISIEMIEAVGHEYLKGYFQACNRLLKPGGRFALQAITYPNEWYDEYRSSTDFIRTYIFPGGHLPSLGIMELIVREHMQLQLVDEFNIAQSYAKTLNEWRQRFNNQQSTIFKMGFDQVFFENGYFILHIGEAAFKTDYLGVIN